MTARLAKDLLQAASIPEIAEAAVRFLRARSPLSFRLIWGPALPLPGERAFRIEDRGAPLGVLLLGGGAPGGEADALVEEVADLVGVAVRHHREAQALLLAHDRAVEASRAKSAFLANVSHELRTPLNAIIGYVELIDDGIAETPTEEIRQDLAKVHGAARHLLTLLNDVLDLAKVEAGKLILDPVEMDARPLVEEVEDAVAPLVSARKNRYLWTCPPELPIVADPTRLKQVLYNLIGNAAKFTRAGTIRLDVTQGPEFAEFAVSDTGIGIRPEKLPSLFEAFTQVHTKQSEDFGGTGLGLVISRRYCRMMGGDIEVKSAVGQGTTFLVRLPRTAG